MAVKKSQDKGVAAKVMQRLGNRVSPDKSPRTLFLNTKNYESLEEVCKGRGLRPSHVIDELIREFLDEIGQPQKP